MFGRLLWKLLRGNRGRLTVALVAVISGAAVISALLNLQFDIERKLTQEFRALGPNVTIGPRQAAQQGDAAATSPTLMDQAAVARAVEQTRTGELVGAAPYLYVVARVGDTPVVVAGTNLDDAQKIQPSWKLEENAPAKKMVGRGIVGSNVARQLKLTPGSEIELTYLGRSVPLVVGAILDSGAAEDDQILVDLAEAQQLANSPGQIEAEELRVQGNAPTIAAYAARLGSSLPDYDVRPVRQVTEAEGNLLGRTRLLIASTIVLILALTALCVLATMAALAMERRADVGLMKALGGSISRIVALFLAEVGVLGAAGGAIGCVAGYALASWMGKRVFDAAVEPRWQIFPLTVVMMAAVAMTGALPLWQLGRVKPAVILRGE
jgi:putative ABC transport system permease protein